jgi:hypothetical protein
MQAIGAQCLCLQLRLIQAIDIPAGCQQRIE